MEGASTNQMDNVPQMNRVQTETLKQKAFSMNEEKEGMPTFVTNAKQQEAAALRRKDDARAIAKHHLEPQKHLADLQNDIKRMEQQTRLREERLLKKPGLSAAEIHMFNKPKNRIDLNK